MTEIKSLIGKAAGFIALLGLASIVLYIFNYNVRLLMWIDMWGTTVGWALRIGFVVVGAALFLLFGMSKNKEEASE